MRKTRLEPHAVDAEERYGRAIEDLARRDEALVMLWQDLACLDEQFRESAAELGLSDVVDLAERVAIWSRLTEAVQ